MTTNLTLDEARVIVKRGLLQQVNKNAYGTARAKVLPQLARNHQEEYQKLMRDTKENLLPELEKYALQRLDSFSSERLFTLAERFTRRQEELRLKQAERSKARKP